MKAESTCKLVGIPAGQHSVLLIPRARRTLLDNTLLDIARSDRVSGGGKFSIATTAHFSDRHSLRPCYLPAAWLPPPGPEQDRSSSSQFRSPGVTCPIPHSDQEALVFVFLLDRAAKQTKQSVHRAELQARPVGYDIIAKFGNNLHIQS